MMGESDRSSADQSHVVFLAWAQAPWPYPSYLLFLADQTDRDTLRLPVGKAQNWAVITDADIISQKHL